MGAGAECAGKTQLLKLLAGDVWPDPADTPREAIGIAAVAPGAGEVKEHIAYLGPERQDRYERYGGIFFRRGKWWPRASTAATFAGAFHVPHRETQPFAAAARGMRSWRTACLLTLSYGERRLVCCARVIALEAGLLLLDEVATGWTCETVEAAAVFCEERDPNASG